MSLDLAVAAPINATAQTVVDQNGNQSALMVASNRIVANVKSGGEFVIGNPSTGQGGYTSIVMSISKGQGGDTTIQAIESSGTKWGNLNLNPHGGGVSLPASLTISQLTTPPPGAATVDLVIDTKTGRIYRQG